MQAIMETLFDIVYLSTVIFLGYRMLQQSKGKPQGRLLGWMAVILGCGDAFHLIPRAYALCTDGLAYHAGALGAGKFVTSITMTVFYLLLYQAWRLRYQVSGHGGLTGLLYGLGVLRIILCLFPQNLWLSADPSLRWGIYRNLPFAVMGLLMILLFYRATKGGTDPCFRWMWLAIAISFGCYLPVVLWGDLVPAVGALMIPKTCAYVWMVVMGYRSLKQKKQPKRFVF